ncbi:MAG: hypothetical protein NXI10_17010 [bacterium]|nr:hypothetical protein [bacterium]
MRQMYRFLFFGLLILVATSCRRSVDSLSLNDAERRIVGTWTMEQVKNNVRGDGKWGRNDVSGSFRGWELTFNANYSLEIYIPDEDLHLTGTWEMYEDWSTDSDGDREWNTFLYISAWDPQNPDVWREFTWQDMRVSSSDLKAEEETRIHGERVFYFYTLGR